MFVDVDEFRTSKLCCACHGKMNGKMMKTGKRSYKVRHCENSACHRTFWNRDVNASINILFRFMREVRGEEEPAAFRRQKINS
jgi:transposase